MATTPTPREKISLNSIPNEIVSHLLYFLPPEDNLLCFQLLSKHLNRLANSRLLWRHHCKRAFKYWNPDHEFQRKLEQPIGDVNWKHLFLVRKERNTRIAQLFDGILARRLHRLHRFEQLCQLGYDAKDFLLDQCATEEDAQDALARRYYARHVLDSIHRSIAIEEWRSLMVLGQNGNREDTRHSNIVIERCLAALGMFVLHNQYGDVDEVSLMLDNLAAEFRNSEPRLGRLTTREKASALNRWLRAKNLTGIASPARHYRRMRNCFIGQAILHEPHESLPLISSAIFCSLAARVGLSAQSCLFPGHVHVAVFPEPHQTLGDGDVLLSGEGRRVDIMYLDPYGADQEVSEDFLRSLVNSFGWRYHARQFLSPTRPWHLMMRMVHNVEATLQHETRESDQDDPYVSPVDATRPVSGSSVVNREAAEYSRLWLRVMLYRPGTPEWKEVLWHLLDVILNHNDSKWRDDLWLVRKYLYPMFDNLNSLNFILLDGVPGGPRRVVDTYMSMDKESWVTPKERREGSDSIYRIGQVVYNERLNYAAIVIGWGLRADETGAGVGEGDEVPEKWYNLLRASSLEVLRFVPHDRLVPVNDRAQIPEELFELAGLYFDRFDWAHRETCRFIPSEPLKYEYPDG